MPLFKKLEVTDVHLSVAGEGAYGSVSTLTFTLVNKGFTPALYRVYVEFYGVNGEKVSKRLVGFLSPKDSRMYTLDEYINTVKAKITVKRLASLVPDATVETTPT